MNPTSKLVAWETLEHGVLLPSLSGPGMYRARKIRPLGGNYRLRKTRSLGHLGDDSVSADFSSPNITIDATTASYALYGVAGLLLVAVLTAVRGRPAPRKKPSLSKRIGRRARRVYETPTTIGSVLPWVLIIGGVAYLVGGALVAAGQPVMQASTPPLPLVNFSIPPVLTMP
jgi:hypothetical protein